MSLPWTHSLNILLKSNLFLPTLTVVMQTVEKSVPAMGAPWDFHLPGVKPQLNTPEGLPLPQTPATPCTQVKTP